MLGYWQYSACNDAGDDWMHHARSIAQIDQNLVFLVQGKDKRDREAFYYVLVDKLKKDIFIKDIHKGMMDLRRFGKILISGYGPEPTDHAKAYLLKEFGIKLD